MAKKKTKYEKPTVVPLGETAGGAACTDGANGLEPSSGKTGAPCDCGSSTQHCFVGDLAAQGCATGTSH